MIGPMLAGGVCGLGGFAILRSLTDGLPGPKNARQAVVVHYRQKKAQERAILRLSEEAFAASVVSAAVVGVFGSCLIVALLTFSKIRIPMPALFCFVAVGPFVAAALRMEKFDKAAERARQTFSYALSSYLDLASVLLAGGSGTETALIAAARTGDSWAFRLISDAIENARIERRPMWAALADLGRSLGVVDLERVAGSMQLAGEQGARVRLSLATQAEALRSRQVSEIEASAQAATERMGVPTVLLFVGFIALLGYPALDLIVGQM